MVRMARWRREYASVPQDRLPWAGPGCVRRDFQRRPEWAAIIQGSPTLATVIQGSSTQATVIQGSPTQATVIQSSPTQPPRNDNAALLGALHATDFLGQNDAALKALAADNGPLKLDNSSSFAGTVAGMTGQDTLDLADKDPDKVQPRSFSGNSLGGMLTVTEGMHTPNVALLGNYMASVFVAQSDGHGGTTITDPVIAAQNQITLPHA